MLKKSIRFITTIVTFSIIFGIVSFAGQNIKNEDKADALKEMGLFSGTSKGFELDRAPTRVEAAAMLVKLLGKEDEAKAKNYDHPFLDVPTWADSVIGYMYHNKMTTGIGNNMFGASQLISAKDYTVFVLKALDYTTTDFEYSKTMEFAKSIGLITHETADELTKVTFRRDEMVLLAYNSLYTKSNGTNQLLIERLGKQNTASAADAFKNGNTVNYNGTLSNLDSTSQTLEIQNEVIKIKATKKEINNASREKITGYDGSIGLVYGHKQWDGMNIYYEMAFYNKGVLVKTIDIVSFDYKGYVGGSHSIFFMTPADPFDEIKISAYPLVNKNYDTLSDDYVVLMSATEFDAIFEYVRGFKGLSIAGISGASLTDVPLETFKLRIQATYLSGTHYPDGNYFRAHTSVDLFPDASSSIYKYDYKFSKSRGGGTFTDSQNNVYIQLPITPDYTQNPEIILLYDSVNTTPVKCLIITP